MDDQDIIHRYKFIFGFSLAGLLFSGYLSAVKFFTNTCAFNEGCPLFLGYPACYFGFAMYFALTDLSFLLLLRRLPFVAHQASLMGIAIVSFLGILFAGYFTLSELPRLFSLGFRAYVFGLPTCAFGLIFYATIFGMALPLLLRARTRKR